MEKLTKKGPSHIIKKLLVWLVILIISTPSQVALWKDKKIEIPYLPDMEFLTK